MYYITVKRGDKKEMEKGQEGSGDLSKKEPIEFRGMGEGAIEALVGKEGLEKLRIKINGDEFLASRTPKLDNEDEFSATRIKVGE